MNDNQLKKLEALKKFAEDKDLATLEHFISIGEKLDNQSEQLATLEDIKQAIKDFEIPEPKDEQENFDKIMAKLDEEDEIEITLNIT